MRRSHPPDLGDLDAAGVISVYAQQRELSRRAHHPVCGEFMGLTWRRQVRVCSLDPKHEGAHSTVSPPMEPAAHE